MKRGARPPLWSAFLWTFAAGAHSVHGVEHRDPVSLACVFGLICVGPVAWFVGQP